VGDFDDAFIAKIYNFKDKYDYYAQCGSKFFLHKIRIPAIAINAIDDPFIEADSLPTDQDVQLAPVRLIYHEYGGHCGFSTSTMSVSAASDGQTTSSSSSLSIGAVPKHGWLAEEFARCLSHIRDNWENIETGISRIDGNEPPTTTIYCSI
jgi:predicted alpha/beta-fold hydrolase